MESKQTLHSTGTKFFSIVIYEEQVTNYLACSCIYKLNGAVLSSIEINIDRGEVIASQKILSKEYQCIPFCGYFRILQLHHYF